MGDNLKSVAVGDTILTESIHRNAPPRLREMVVTKVGRKYLYASPQVGWTETKFNIDNGIEAEGCQPLRAFLSADSYQKYLARNELMRKAREAAKSLDDWGGRVLGRLSEEDLNAIIAIAERGKAEST